MQRVIAPAIGAAALLVLCGTAYAGGSTGFTSWQQVATTGPTTASAEQLGVDGQGRIFVLLGTGEIGVWAPGGQVLSTWSPTRQLAASTAPSDMVVTNDGSVILLYPLERPYLRRFAADGELQQTWGADLTQPGWISLGRNGDLLVSDYNPVSGASVRRYAPGESDGRVQPGYAGAEGSSDLLVARGGEQWLAAHATLTAVRAGRIVNRLGWPCDGCVQSDGPGGFALASFRPGSLAALDGGAVVSLDPIRAQLFGADGALQQVCSQSALPDRGVRAIAADRGDAIIAATLHGIYRSSMTHGSSAGCTGPPLRIAGARARLAGRGRSARLRVRFHLNRTARVRIDLRAAATKACPLLAATCASRTDRRVEAFRGHRGWNDVVVRRCSAGSCLARPSGTYQVRAFLPNGQGRADASPHTVRWADTH